MQYLITGIIKIANFDFDNISLNEKSFENVLIYLVQTIACYV